MPRRAAHLLACSGLALASAAEAGETVSYDYDALGRLTATTSSGTVNNGVATGIAYDPAGNRSAYTVSGAGSSGSPTVTGGGFEAPDLGASYLYRPTLAFRFNSGIAGNGSAWGFADAPEGDQVAFLQTIDQPALVSLPVSGLVAGTRYVANFHLSQRPGYPVNPITVAFDGSPLGTFSPASATFAAVTSAVFTAGSGTGTLTFTGASYSGDATTGLDNVTVAVAP